MTYNKNNKSVDTIDQLTNYLEAEIREAAVGVANQASRDLRSNQGGAAGEISILNTLLNILLHPQNEEKTDEPAVNQSSIEDNGVYVALGKLYVALGVVPSSYKHDWLPYLVSATVHDQSGKSIHTADQLSDYLKEEIGKAAGRITDQSDRNLRNDQRAASGEILILGVLFNAGLNTGESAANKSSIEDNREYVALGRLLAVLEVVPFGQERNWLLYLVSAKN